jgi:hypothetical protein
LLLPFLTPPYLDLNEIISRVRSSAQFTPKSFLRLAYGLITAFFNFYLRPRFTCRRRKPGPV